MPTIPLAEKLIKRFQATFEGAPEWAWPFEPSIPLVGRNYKPGRGLLVYASAENLSWMRNRRHERRRYFDEPDVWNRYREQYEHLGRKSNSFFPDVGIQPITDGGLFAAASFVSDARGLPTPTTPRALLETIALTNWCKFVRSDSADYTDLGHLLPSLPFIVAELTVLRPKAILIAKPGIWQKKLLRTAMWAASPKSLVVDAYQFTPRALETPRLRAFSRLAENLKRRAPNSPWVRWMAELAPRIEGSRAWRYIAYLEEQVRRGKSI